MHFKILYLSVLGLHGQAWVVGEQGGGYNSGFCKELLEASTMSGTACPWWLQREDMLLVKAGAIRNGGYTSVITYLRRNKKMFCTVVIETREEKGGIM